MPRKKTDALKKSAVSGSGEASAYDTATPLWSRYYHELRKRLRFPRHYKKEMNW